MSASSSPASASTPIGSDRDLLRGARGAGGAGPGSGSHAGGSGDGGRRRRGPAGRSNSRALLVAAGLAAALLLTFDLTRAPERQRTARALVAAIGHYQATLSPVLGKVGARCRFVPSCSHYAADAIRTDGAIVGAARAIARIARCGPWTPLGTVDPA